MKNVINFCGADTVNSSDLFNFWGYLLTNWACIQSVFLDGKVKIVTVLKFEGDNAEKLTKKR